jgi:CarD family transcriptional regulator, regulator of rRNA transcription
VFETGDLLIHPAHGVGRVVARERRVEGDVERDVLIMEFRGGGLRVSLPVERIEAARLRPVLSPKAAEKVLAVLAEPVQALPSAALRRRALMAERLSNGDAAELAGLVRDLRAAGAARSGGLAPSDRDAERTARARLVDELAAALDKPPAVADRLIEERLAPAVAA